MKFSSINIYVFLASVCYCQGQTNPQVVNMDYYWRDYTGIIPSDAVPGGADINNITTFIGQGFDKDHGMIPGMIYQGQNYITIPQHGTKQIDTYIRILCSPNLSAFHWFRTDEREFALQTMNKVLVRGGHEDGYILNIGRIAFQGEIVTGKIVTGSNDYPDVAPMFFVHKQKENKATRYEVLTYDPSETNAIDRTFVRNFS